MPADVSDIIKCDSCTLYRLVNVTYCHSRNCTHLCCRWE